jgi:hypothetical protein
MKLKGNKNEEKVARKCENIDWERRTNNNKKTTHTHTHTHTQT